MEIGKYWHKDFFYKEPFLKYFLEDICSFMGPLIPLFRTSGDISSGFQSQSGQPYSHFSTPLAFSHIFKMNLENANS